MEKTKVTTEQILKTVVYLLMRDHMPAIKVQELLTEAETVIEYCGINVCMKGISSDAEKMVATTMANIERIAEIGLIDKKIAEIVGATAAQEERVR